MAAESLQHGLVCSAVALAIQPPIDAAQLTLAWSSFAGDRSRVELVDALGWSSRRLREHVERWFDDARESSIAVLRGDGEDILLVWLAPEDVRRAHAERWGQWLDSGAEPRSGAGTPLVRSSLAPAAAVVTEPSPLCLLSLLAQHPEALADDGAAVWLDLEPGECDRVAAAAAALGVTAAALALTGLACWLSVFARLDEVAIAIRRDDPAAAPFGSWVERSFRVSSATSPGALARDAGDALGPVMTTADGGDGDPGACSVAFASVTAESGDLRRVATSWHGAHARLRGHDVRRWTDALGVGPFELLLEMVETEGRIALGLRFAATRWDHSVVTEMLAAIQRAVVAVADRPADRLGSRALLGDEDVRRLAPPPPMLRDDERWASLPEQFSARAALAPGAVALTYRGQQLTYGELLRRTEAFARRLADAGVTRASRVGILLDPVDRIVAALAVLTCGGAFTLLTENDPAERLTRSLSDAEVTVVVTSSKSAGLGAFAGTVLALDDAHDAHDAAPRPGAAVPRRAVGQGDLACIVHPPSTSCRPERLLIEHGSLSRVASAFLRELALGPGTRALSLRWAGLDPLFVLLAGGTVCAADAEEVVPGPALASFLARAAITTLFIDDTALAATDPDGADDLAVVVAGGEAVTAELVARWAAGRTFLRAYGHGLDAALVRCRPDVRARSLGRPIEGARIYVLTPDLESLPALAIGEIAVGGASAPRGLAGHPRLTAERFVPDPFAAEAGARMYRTGDLGRSLPDATIELLSRHAGATVVEPVPIEDSARALTWWRRELAGAPRALSLPSARTPADAASPRPFSLPVPRRAVGRLQALAREEGTTLDVVCLAVLVTVIHRYTGENDFVLGVSATSERTGAPGARAFILRADAGADPTLRELVRRTSARQRRAQAHPLSLAELAAALPGAGVALVVRIEERDEGILLALEHDGARIDPGIGEGLARHFARLADSGGRRPDRRVRSLPMLDPAEHEAIVRMGAGAHGLTRLRPFHLAFAEVAARQPSALAVTRGAERVDYGELETRSNALAHRLLALGLQREGRVGICLLRSPGFLVAMLGVWKAGGAYVPIDPAHPRERITFVCNDSAITAMITTEALLQGLPPLACPLVCLDGEQGQAAQAWPSSPPASAEDVTGARLAYLIYTSGSTGRPRAVMVEHGSLANAAANSLSAYRLGPGTRMLYLTSSSFDASLDEMFVLLGGGSLSAPPEEAESPGPDLLAFLARERITVAMMTPSMLAAMDPFELPALELLVVGGEACPGEIVDRWQPGRRFLNAYGPTEATVYATLGECAAGDGTPTIGRPIAGAHCYVVDRNLELVPRGIAGELCIGGAAVARGYHGRPDLTSALFVADPHHDWPGARMYRTGDVARFRPDGELEYLGRRDEQVKVRGVRIDLGEISAVLLEHAVVREAVVVQRRDADGALVAYIVLRTAGALGELRKHLRDRLPAAFVPSWLVPLDAIPRNTSGKVDRDRLPVPTGTDDGVPIQLPTTPSERSLFEIWTDLLRHDRFGIDHDFFDVGGHSLAAAQLVARIQRQLGIRLSLSEVIRSPTIREMADVIERLRAAQSPAPSPGVTRFQRACWHLAARDPRRVGIHDRSVRIRGALDVDALERALAEVVARHAILRTTFRIDDDGQVTPSDTRGRRARLVAHDLRCSPAAARAQRVEQVLHAARTAPFDLGVGPLFRRALVSVADEEHLLLMLFHPAITDAAAEDAVAEEIAALYLAYRDAMRPALAPPRAQLVDALQSARRAASMGDAPSVMPATPAAPDAATRKAHECSATIPPELWQSVVDRAAAAGVTPDVLALAAFAVSAPAVFGAAGAGPIAVPVPSSALAEHGVLVGPWIDLSFVDSAAEGGQSRDALVSAVAAALDDARAHAFAPTRESAVAWPRVAFELRTRPRTLELDALEVSPLVDAAARLDLPGDLALRIELQARAPALATIAFLHGSGEHSESSIFDHFLATLAGIARATL